MKRSPMRRTVGLKRVPMKRSLKPIALMSKRRARYLRKREVVVWVGQPCAIQSPVCTGRAEGTHHAAPRGAFGGLEAADRIRKRVPACNRCNEFVQLEGRRWALANGWLISPKGRAA